MLADRPLTPTARTVGRVLLLLVLAGVLFLVFDHGSARATTPDGQHSGTVAAAGASHLRPEWVAAGAPRASAAPSPSSSSPSSKTKKKSSSLVLPVIVVGLVLVVYMASRKRKMANGGGTPARGGLGGGLFGGGARRSPPPRGGHTDASPDLQPRGTPPARPDAGRPRPKRRGR